MLFHYAKTRKRQAINVALNMLLLPLILYLFHHLVKDEPNYEELYAAAEIIACSIAMILTGILIWFLKSKEKFELYVTENEFYSYHPVFKEWCFSVNPNDIAAIEHHLGIGSGSMTNINARLKNGRELQICQNYPFSRKELYSALQKINPDIHLPDHANLFTHKPGKEADEYVSTRFPVTTRIIKAVLSMMPGKK